jgi:hypothetical protein
MAGLDAHIPVGAQREVSPQNQHKFGSAEAFPLFRFEVPGGYRRDRSSATGAARLGSHRRPPSATAGRWRPGEVPRLPRLAQTSERLSPLLGCVGTSPTFSRGWIPPGSDTGGYSQRPKQPRPFRAGAFLLPTNRWPIRCERTAYVQHAPLPEWPARYRTTPAPQQRRLHVLRPRQRGQVPQILPRRTKASGRAGLSRLS